MTRYGTSTSAPLQGGFDASDVFGMSSFSLNNSRKRKSGSSFARFTTRAVLLSPLLILSVWSIVVMCSGTRKVQQTTQLQMRPHSKRKGTDKRHMSAQQSGQIVVQPPNLTEQQVQYMASNKGGKHSKQHHHPHHKSVNQGKMVPIYVPLGDSQQMQAAAAEQIQTMNGATSTMGTPLDGRIIPIYAPLGDAQLPAQGSAIDGKMIPIYAPLGDTQQQQQAQGSVLDGKMIPVYGPLGGAQQTPVQTTVEGAPLAQQTTPLGDVQQQASLQQSTPLGDVQQQASLQQTTPLGQQQAPLQTSPQAKMVPIYVPFGDTQQMQAAAVQEVARMQAANSNMMNAQGANIMMNTQELGEQVTADTPQTSASESVPAMTSNSVVVRPLPQGSTTSSSSSGTTTILYYDPDAATIDGQLYVPQVVYDADGIEVDLKSLQASSNAEVYLEPPSTTINIPKQQMSRQDLASYAAEPPAQDQYIIIATVAVMALLVGALSARRMRSRNFLSSCIENESLEDEVAYDVATTNGDYSTFGGHWKGDLEKFDV